MKLLHSHKLLGTIFIALVLAGVYGTYAVFSKKYVDYERVTLQTSTIGLQLPQRADVKVRGVIVGEVLGFDVNAEGAQVELGLYPESVGTIPRDVTGSIVPKTLFGEKYVSLVVPDQPSQEHIKAGDVIKPTVVGTEVEKVLRDLYPLLTAVQPAQLNMTLNAIATALEGRGDALGENLETVDAYLKRMNPQIPALVEDLRLTAQVSDVYADVLPQVADILDNTVKTTGTFEDGETQLQALYTDVAGFADTSRTFLQANGDNIIRLGEVSAPQLRLLARYSTEFPCLLGGIVRASKLQAEAFRGFTLHIVLETLPNQPRAYGPQDKPRFGEDRGPSCLHLPNPPWSQSNPVRRQPNFNDGVDEPTGKGTSRAAPGFAYRPASGYAGSPQEAVVLKQLLAPGMGVAASDVPDLGPLLLGPLARGAKVSMR